jgi:hypothetical protein
MDRDESDRHTDGQTDRQQTDRQKEGGGECVNEGAEKQRRGSPRRRDLPSAHLSPAESVTVTAYTTFHEKKLVSVFILCHHTGISRGLFSGIVPHSLSLSFFRFLLFLLLCPFLLLSPSLPFSFSF